MVTQSYKRAGVEQFEKSFAEFCTCRFAIGVGSGTDALH